MFYVPVGLSRDVVVVEWGFINLVAGVHGDETDSVEQAERQDFSENNKSKHEKQVFKYHA